MNEEGVWDVDKLSLHSLRKYEVLYMLTLCAKFLVLFPDQYRLF